MLELSKIKKGAQARKSINEETIAEYAEHISNGGTFPPIVVFYDSKTYWLADGWHRLIAHERVGCLTILEEVHTGSERDALKYALGANDGHGLRRSNADKRNSVEMALADSEWSKLTTREIAELCKVSHNLVSEMQRGITKEKKTEQNKNEYQTKSVGCNPITENLQASENKAEKKAFPKPEIPQEPEYTELDALYDQVTELQNIVAAGFAGTTDEERASGLKLIADLRQEIKTLTATLDAVTISRDTFQRENSEMKKQLARQRNEIEKLMGK